MQERVPVANDRKNVQRIFGFAFHLQPGRRYGMEGRVPEIRPVQARKERAIRMIYQARAHIRIVGRKHEFAHEQLPNARRHILLDFKPNDRGEPPLSQLVGHHLDQVVRFLLVPADVRIARNLKGVRVLNLHAAKQFVQIMLNHLLQRHKMIGVFEGHPAPPAGRHFDAGEMLGAAFGMPQQNGQRKAQVGNKRKRVPGVYGKRRQNGKNMGREVLVQLRFLARRKIVVGKNPDVRRLGQLRSQRRFPQGRHRGVHG